MTHHFRLLPSFAVAICVTAAIGCATPAAAVEDSAAAKGPAVKSSDIRTSPSVTKRHISHRTRLAITRYNRRVGLVGSGPECSGVWCGRQFVLMIGIGF